MGITSPRKRRITFGLVALLVALALGNVLWYFQDAWLPFWFPSSQEPAPPVVLQAAVEPPSGQPVAPLPELQVPAPLGPALDFLSAAAWDHPQFLQGVRMFNEALDQYRGFLQNRSSFSPLIQAEEGALQAAQVFNAIRADAPASVPLGDYVVRCQTLVGEVRRLGRTGTPAIPASVPSSAPRPMAPPPRAGETWQEPDYLQGAKLFNQALEQYQLFLADKSRTELLKPIEDTAFQAAKKFEALKELAPTNVPVEKHISQCYKLISDCRRQNLESGGSAPATGGPGRRPALPAYQPPQ